jgi:hypothetical protein
MQQPSLMNFHLEQTLMYVSAQALLDYLEFPTNANQSPAVSCQVTSLFLHWFGCHLDAISKISSCMDNGDNNLHIFHQFQRKKPFWSSTNLLLLNLNLHNKREIWARLLLARHHCSKYCCYIITKPFLHEQSVWSGGLPSLWWLLHLVLDSWA